MELFAVTWESQAGARFHVIHVQGQPRKHLYDLNGDGIVQLETWDVDGDGRFEARREARFPVPEFLLPLPTQRPELTLPDTVPPDSAWLALFRNTAAGPLRFAQQARMPPPRPAMPGDTTADGLPSGDLMEPLPPPDSAWLDLFRNTAAGPFRFSRRPQPPPQDTIDAARDTVVVPDTAAPAPPPQPRPPRPLGTPIPTPRRDTIRR
jgi:hypothetical protein